MLAFPEHPATINGGHLLSRVARLSIPSFPQIFNLCPRSVYSVDRFRQQLLPRCHNAEIQTITCKGFHRRKGTGWDRRCLTSIRYRTHNHHRPILTPAPVTTGPAVKIQTTLGSTRTTPSTSSSEGSFMAGRPSIMARKSPSNLPEVMLFRLDIRMTNRSVDLASRSESKIDDLQQTQEGTKSQPKSLQPAIDPLTLY